MANKKTVFVCGQCGYETSKWSGMCVKCKAYNSFLESEGSVTAAVGATGASVMSLSGGADESKRILTNIGELDRVLSGGIVEGSVILLGGEPGVGKSTLLLQICGGISAGGKSALYISAEESLSQIKQRAERLCVAAGNISAAAEVDINVIEKTTAEVIPDILLIDSVQTIYNPEMPSLPGSVNQVRDCTARLTRLAKTKGVSVILVGHVTKDGAIAGPKVLEHMVDTVLYFEGERHANYRIIRSVKNRFGPSNEIGVFEMREKGLIEILNPSEYMLNGRLLSAAGSAVTALIEGSRPLLIELQALVSYTSFGTPRRSANGMDFNRSVMLIAVLEKRAGINLSAYDCYLNIAGGLKVAQPAADLAAVAAIASSFKNIPVNANTAFFGEVGLTGEVRAVTRPELRLREAAKFGFKSCVVPQVNMPAGADQGMKVYGVSNISEMLEILF